MLASLLFAPLLALGVRAQLNAGEIDGLVENFKNAGLGDLVGDSFKPDALITGNFNGKNLEIGQPQTQADAGNFPTLFIQPAPNTTFNASQAYTALMLDANVVGTSLTGNAETLHWLINTLHINTTTTPPMALNYTGGTTITEYAGPGPAAGSGPHRYVLMLIEQPADFAAPANLSQQNTAVGPFDFQTYLKDAKLGKVVGANYFTVENGQATVTLSATQAVNSSTLSGYTGAAPIPTAVGGSNNGTAGGNGTATGNGTAGGNGSTGAGGNGSTGTGGSGTTGGNGTSPTGTAKPGAAMSIAAPVSAVAAVVLGAVALIL